jgi:hypothetical protein
MFMKLEIFKWEGPICVWKWPSHLDKYIKLDWSQLTLKTKLMKTKYAPMLIQNINLFMHNNVAIKQ